MMTEFVHLKMKNNPAVNAELFGYEDIIREQAEKGFAYAGFVPTKYGPSGKLVELTLVFQK